MHKRTSERNALRRKLEANVNIHMPAPRRIGKTWTINRLAEDLRGQGWLVVELDVQGLSCPVRFAKQLCMQVTRQLPLAKGLWAGLGARLENVLGGDWGGDPMKALGDVEPIDFLAALVEELAKEENKAAIFVDEIAYFVLAFAESQPDAVKDFFYQLRGIQMKNRSVRWLFTGSIGLDVIAERYEIGGAFVDLERFILEPFTVEEARSFLRDDATQTAFNHKFWAEDKDLDILFLELGWLAPYYLKLVGNEVRPTGVPRENGEQTATISDLEAALERLLEPNRKGDFAVWREHVDKNLPQTDRAVARKLLDVLSRKADGENLDTLIANFTPAMTNQLKPVLDILQNDGLIQKISERYRFRSGLIRRYWLEYEAE